ncbi:hypothetical protein [Bacillus sp. EB600]|uniref:hypothetical protein n=1 Tax=Bacillus sp. EB600 TaxID=2806345 RepID=UPI00210C95C5|nr:hypothetical protein [Bacillus sp. EB600]MCQ6280793.1 hypothetical protein [Bacillus sp. EB600]
MAVIAQNEIEFFNFLKDEFKTGTFYLKLVELNNQDKITKRKKKSNKRKVLIYKKQTKPGTVTLYEKKNGKVIGIYMKETNTLMAENVKRFISLRIKLLENENPKDSSKSRSPRLNEEAATVSVQEEDSIVRNAFQKPALEENGHIQNFLNNDLNGAKKVWAIMTSGEEIQVENRIFNESDIAYVGNSKTKVDLKRIKAIKFRGKVYSD